MKRLLATCVLILLTAGFSNSQENFTISLKNGTASEQQTKLQLERLLKKYDLSKWIFTRSVLIDAKVIPHSHPVLTLSARHLLDDDLLLSTFVHEQIHWFLIQDQKVLGAVLDDLKKKFPTVPTAPGEGARDESSTYLHLAVCYLEYRAVRELLGELRGKQIIDFWATDHYKWIYRTVRDQPRDVGDIMFKHKLVPGLKSS